MPDAKANAAIRKVMTTQASCKKTEGMLETSRKTHRAAILAATELGVAKRELARRLGISEVVLREKVARARVEGS
jgi:DNA-binding transcriptional regulator LsrR (DeoR family)